MSRYIKPDLKPTVKKIPVSARKSPTRFPSVSLISPRHSVDGVDSDLKWAVDMVRGITIPRSPRETERSRGHTQSNKNVNHTERFCNNKDHEKLNQKNLSLQKLVNQLREEVKVKNKSIVERQEQLDKNESEYKISLKEHEETIKKHESKIGTLYEEMKGLKDIVLERTREMDIMKNELEQTRKECEEKVDSVMKKTDLQISSLCKNHKKELADRDAKLAFLKTQLESTLNNNSKERQRQLDELTKELTRVTDETEMLKAKLRSLAKQKQNDKCRNCASLEEVIQSKQNEIREKDGSIVELLKHCQKMSVQLSRTDEFVKLLEENKLKYGSCGKIE